MSHGDPLTRIADALERIAVVLESFEPVPSDAVCSHPAERREDFSAMGATRWRCLDCGFSVGLEGSGL